jgi:hypothetical protein
MERRARYLGLFAHLYGFRPPDVDALVLEDFQQLAAWADEYVRQQNQDHP